MMNENHNPRETFNYQFELKSEPIEESLSHKLFKLSATVKDLLNFIHQDSQPLAEFHTENSVALEFNIPDDELQNFFFTMHELTEQSTIAELPHLEELILKLKKTSSHYYDWQLNEVVSLLKAYHHTHQQNTLGITAYALLKASNQLSPLTPP